jgi:Zn-dependent protease with chaperone function
MKLKGIGLVCAALIVLAAVMYPAGSYAQEAAGAVQGFDADAATNAYLATLSGAEKEKSDAYFEGGYWLILWGMLYGLAVAFLLLRKGFSARLRDWCTARSKRRFLQTVYFGGAYLLLASLLSLPWTIYTGFVREHQYELATQTFGAWLGDQAMSLALSLVFGSLVIALFYALIRKLGARWWLWATASTGVLLVFLVMISPVFIAPLFNNYTPLEDGKIKQEILAMTKSQGVEFDTVYMVDASAQSTRISANVSGLGATKRISLNDNLLNQASVAEIKAVMGHELGHYMLNHGLVLIGTFTLLFGFGFFIVSKSFVWANRRWGAHWGITGLGDIAGLPLAAALFSVYLFFMTPVFNTVIRINESQADAFGLAVAQEPDGFATIALKLAKYRKLEPGALEEILFFDHPSGRTRVQMSMDWKAAHMADAAPE